MKKISRRKFLKSTGAGAALMTLPGSTFSQMIQQPGKFTDFRALVCVFLFGGNDSFNMLVPRSGAEYNVYADSRQNLAIARESLLPIQSLNPDGSLYGLHPSMNAIHNLFESQRAAFVANVGPLIEPTTKEQYRNKSVKLPPQLFSHNDQQAQWQTLRGQKPSKTGWAGRVADLLRLNVSSQRLAINVSLSGNQLMQESEAAGSYVIGPNGPLAFLGFDTGRPSSMNYFPDKQRIAFNQIIGANYNNLYEQAFAEIQERAIANVDSVNSAFNSAPPLATPFPASSLSQQLKTVARLISVREQLQMKRQIFFVATGGFDSHDDQIQNQPGLLNNVSESINAFYNATIELGVSSEVTTFTQSDFGRTLTSNGDGTDHGWGGVQMIVGDSVLGRNIYGVYPRLEIDGPDDVRGGRMIPTTSADQYAATLAKWIGIPGADLVQVAPNINNFFQQDLGFLI